jgi:hypothetical protein
VKNFSLRQQSAKLNDKIKNLGLDGYEVYFNKAAWVFVKIYGQKVEFSASTYHGMTCKISKFHRDRVAQKLENEGLVRAKDELRDSDVIESIHSYSPNSFGKSFLDWMAERYNTRQEKIAAKLSEMQLANKISRTPEEAWEEVIPESVEPEPTKVVDTSEPCDRLEPLASANPKNWVVNVAEKAIDMGYPKDLVNQHRSNLNKHISDRHAALNLEYSGDLYRDTDNLEIGICDYLENV